MTTQNSSSGKDISRWKRARPVCAPQYCGGSKALAAARMAKLMMQVSTAQPMAPRILRSTGTRAFKKKSGLSTS